MTKRYLIIDTHADEYGAEDCTCTMTVGELIKHLSGFDPNLPIMVGNDKQDTSTTGYEWWWTYGNITADRIRDVEQEEEEEDEEYDTTFPKRISLDNGHSYLTAHEAIEKLNDPECVITWEQIVNQMRSMEREDVHAEYAPCSNEEFLSRYLDIAPWDLIVG